VVGVGLGALSLLYFSAKFEFRSSWPYLLIAIAGASISVALVALLVWCFRGKRSKLFSNRWVDTARGVWEKFQAANRVYRTEPKILILFFVLTIIEQVLSLLMGYMVAPALNLDVAMFDFMAALAMAMLLSRLPVTIDGLGVMEATISGVLIWAGVPVTDSITIVLVGRLMNILAFLPGTIVYSIRVPVSIRSG